MHTLLLCDFKILLLFAHGLYPLLFVLMTFPDQFCDIFWPVMLLETLGLLHIAGGLLVFYIELPRTICKLEDWASVHRHDRIGHWQAILLRF